MTSTLAEKTSAASESAMPPHPADRAPRMIWFEVEDFFRWYNFGGTHPTGIQRVQAEVFRAAQRHSPSAVAFCRLNPISGRYTPIPFEDLVAKYEGNYSNSTFAKIMRAVGSIVRLCVESARDIAVYLTRNNDHGGLFKSGDILIAMGVGLWDPRYGSWTETVKAKHDLRFVLFVHDVIPITHPEYVTKENWYLFNNWFDKTVRSADLVITSSAYTRSQVLDVLAKKSIPAPRIVSIPFGTDFLKTASTPSPLQWPARFAMFVSTLEVRKNHLLLVNVWQRLIAKHGADAVPELLFVGKMGWMIQELKTRLQETNYLNGKVVHFDSLLDADLSEAYRRCLFTIYPSFCEGWGLPISESLGHGKFCIASNRASMPEVGGDLCDYFDPSNEDDAFRTIEHAVLDSSYIAARNEQVVRSYVPGSWDGFIETLMTELARLPGAAGRPA